MVGNGIMNFHTLENSQINYLLDRSFIDPEVKQYWNNACQFDPESAGCRFFKIKFSENFEEINPYNVYSYCYYNDSFTEPQRKF